MSEWVSVRCAHCSHDMRAEQAHLGQHGVCPSCGKEFLLWPDEKPAAPSAAIWFVQVGGRELGPFEPAQLRSFVQEGRIERTTPIRKGQDGSWIAAQNVRGLLDASASRPSPLKGTASRRQPGESARSATRAPARGSGRPKARGASHAGRTNKRGAVAHPPRGGDDFASRMARRPGLVLAMAIGVLAIAGLAIMLIHRMNERREEAAEATRVAAEAEVAQEAAARKKRIAAKLAAPKGPLSVKEIVKQSAPSVAVVLGRNGSGTGFLVAKDVIATNRHVIEDELIRHVKVQFPDVPKKLRGNYGVKLIYEDPDLDLAFLSLVIDLPPLPLAKNHRFEKGDEITVIGSPGVGNGQILSNAISRGIMSTKAEIEGATYYQLDVAINPGNSGGPVFNRKGEVIGVVTLKASQKDGLGFCLPLRSLRESLGRSQMVDDGERNEISAEHRFRVTSRAVLRSVTMYDIAGRIYIDAMERALAMKMDLNEGLRLAQAALHSRLNRFDGHQLAQLRTDAPAVSADRDLTERARNVFSSLWDTYEALKNHVSSPSGTFDGYKKRYEELGRERSRIEALLKTDFHVELDED